MDFKMDKNVVIEELPQEYFSKSSALVMFKYPSCFGCEIIGYDDETLFRCMKNIRYINNYMNDKRRFNFPYSNIPIHNEKKFFINYTVVNQILEYEHYYKLYLYDTSNYKSIYDKSKNKCIDKIIYRVVKDKDSSRAFVVYTDNSDSIFLEMCAEELKHLDVKKIKEPNISLFLNKGITEEDLEKAKTYTKKK